jgi:formylglycine-generating enzyme required for sulfatase activity
MVEIRGDYCERLTQVCLARRKPWQCAEFQAPSVCRGPTRPKRYCIDRYEFPNRAGGVPTVMISWNGAKAECAAIGKRLCTEAEWTLACEGPERMPFPYGFVRDPAACNIDRKSPRVNEGKLYSPRTQADELARLDQRDPSGAREACVSPYGVHDMTGNVDEWVVNEKHFGPAPADGSERPFISALKGGYWGPVRNRCRATTTAHDEWFRYYEVGFRCCADKRG